jgi:hypothetical protein
MLRHKNIRAAVLHHPLGGSSREDIAPLGRVASPIRFTNDRIPGQPQDGWEPLATALGTARPRYRCCRKRRLDRILLDTG